MADIYWQGRRIGSTHGQPDYGYYNGDGIFTATIMALQIDGRYNIRDIATLGIVYDPVFAELRGITNVRLEAAKPDMVRQDEDDISG